jgi:hypothetical protein
MLPIQEVILDNTQVVDPQITDVQYAGNLYCLSESCRKVADWNAFSMLAIFSFVVVIRCERTQQWLSAK